MDKGQRVPHLCPELQSPLPWVGTPQSFLASGTGTLGPWDHSTVTPPHLLMCRSQFIPQSQVTVQPSPALLDHSASVSADLMEDFPHMGTKYPVKKPALQRTLN